MIGKAYLNIVQCPCAPDSPLCYFLENRVWICDANLTLFVCKRMWAFLSIKHVQKIHAIRMLVNRKSKSLVQKYSTNAQKIDKIIKHETHIVKYNDSVWGSTKRYCEKYNDSEKYNCIIIGNSTFRYFISRKVHTSTLGSTTD
jgi:hypothetical protein